MSSEREVATSAVGPAVQEYQEAVAAFDREVAALLGVGESDLACLEHVLGAPDGITPRELADRLGFTTGSVTTMIDRLEKSGYVSRAAHPDDGRKILVRPTKRLSTRSWDLIGPMIEASSTRVLSKFTAAELDAVVRFMRLATTHQREHTELLRHRRRAPKK